MGRAIYQRLGAAFAAVAIGAVGIVVVVQLLRSEPGPVGGSTGTAATAPVQTSTTIAGGSIATPTEPNFPSPPEGAIVSAREAGSRALALAIVPGTPTSLVRVSVISAAGSGAGGLDVSVRFGGARSAALLPCGTGCYQADVAGAASARSASVSLDKKVYPFALSGGTHLSGTQIVDHAATVWRGLKTVVWHERLAGTPTDALHTVYRAVAPDELSYSITGGSQAIIIGGERWDRSNDTARWVRSVQQPPVKQPVPFWVKPLDAHVLASKVFAGKNVWDVSFFDPITPAWFEVEIDKKTGRTLQLWMTAASHFMHHIYGPFNAPFHLNPPAKI